MTDVNWSLSTIALGDVCRVVRGSSPRPAGDPKYFDGDYLPWITVAELTRDETAFVKTTQSFLTKEGADHTRIFEPGTVLLSNSGATLGVPKITAIQAGANDGVAGFLDLSPEVFPLFLYYFLSSLTHHLRTQVASGVGQPNLNTDLIAEIRMHVPPIPEQKAIAGVLSAWDRAIEQTTALIAAKQRLKQGLMQQLLTGKRRFKGFNGEWKHVRIGDIAEEVSLRNGADESTPVLSCTKHAGLVNSLEYFGKRVFSQDTGNYKVVKRGEFAYATNHIEEGSIGLLSSVPAGLVSPMYTVFRTTGDVVSEFLYRVLKTEHYRQIFESFTSASVDRRGSLRWKQFATIPLHLPDPSEQMRLVEMFDEIDLFISQLKAQLEAFKKQKRGLMQKLLTGEVRVSDKLLKQGAKS
jgi:type I restriction enzyme S subunit